jgi:putative two-component system response regulator
VKKKKDQSKSVAKAVAHITNQAGPEVSQGLVGAIRDLLRKAFDGQLPLGEAILDHNSGILARLQGIYGEHPDLMDALVDCARYYYRLGKTTKGIPLAERALELANRARDTARVRVASNVLGACYRDTGNIAMSFKRLEGALTAANTLGDQRQINAVMANVGGVLQTAGLYAEAIECHMKTLDAVRNTNDPQAIEYKFQSLGNLIFCAQRTGKKELIEQAIDELDSLSVTGGISDVSKATAELFVVHGLVSIGFAEQAYDRVQRLQNQFRGSPNKRIQVLTEMAMGMAETRTQRVDVGVTRLMRTYEESRATGLYYDDALRSLIEGHLANRDNATALKYVDELTRYIKRTQTNKLHEQIVLAARVKTRDFGAYSDESNIIEALAADTRLARAREQLGQDQIALYQSWAVTVELIDDATGEHCFRVGRMAALIAEIAGLPKQKCEMIDVAARLHDLGKVGISHNVLLHPGKLSIGDIGIMRAHTDLGFELLNQVNDPTFKMAADIAYCHHEWWDGGGYPRRIRGNNIPIAARVTALADVYDALTHARPYKRAWSHIEAMREILSLRGKQFDPALTDAFVVAVAKWQNEGMEHKIRDTARQCQMVGATEKFMESVRA